MDILVVGSDEPEHPRLHPNRFRVLLSTSVEPGSARFVSEAVSDEGACIIRCSSAMNLDRAANDNNRSGEDPECQ